MGQWELPIPRAQCQPFLQQCAPPGGRSPSCGTAIARLRCFRARDTPLPVGWRGEGPGVWGLCEVVGHGRVRAGRRAAHQVEGRTRADDLGSVTEVPELSRGVVPSRRGTGVGRAWWTETVRRAPVRSSSARIVHAAGMPVKVSPPWNRCRTPTCRAGVRTACGPKAGVGRRWASVFLGQGIRGALAGGPAPSNPTGARNGADTEQPELVEGERPSGKRSRTYEIRSSLVARSAATAAASRSAGHRTLTGPATTPPSTG